MNIVYLRRFLYNHGNIATEGSPTLISNDHRQHCTLCTIQQFGTLYMHNDDDKYPAQPRFEPGRLPPGDKPESIRRSHRGRQTERVKYI